MLLRSVAIDTYIIMYGDNARETVCYLVHVHLKDVLGKACAGTCTCHDAF